MKYMNEIIEIDQAKKYMKKTNAIFYGSVRDIENYFLESFTNLDILADYFNHVLVIIIENDSKDKTKEILQSWKYQDNIKMTKYVIIESDLDIDYPLRATRLAYCRNKILQYIFDNFLQFKYKYAIHCDLDNRFWCLDFESVCNSFQYDLNKWDVMTCIGKNKSYYDFWALRIENTWFDKNVFSCKAEVDFVTKIPEFTDLLNNNLVKTKSSFNGMAIYKLSSLKGCRYNSEHNCDICHNMNQSCFEDNDHIGLHNCLNKQGGNIFINTKMNILSRPETAISYQDFIDRYLTNPRNLFNNPLLYVLKNNMVKNGIWLDIGTNDGETANIISNYTNDKIYSICFSKKHTMLNANVEINNDISMHKNISFVCFNVNDYLTVKKFLYIVFNNMRNGGIIVFDYFINYQEYLHKSLKAFYEITQELNIKIQIIGINGTFHYQSNDKYSDYFNYKGNNMVALRIINNPMVINEPEIVKFNYKDYIKLNNDLNAEANEIWEHWIKYGMYENRRVYFHWQKYKHDFQLNNLYNKKVLIQHVLDNENDNMESYFTRIKFDKEENDQLIEKYNGLHYGIIPDDFNWANYVFLNKDLLKANINTAEKTFVHWINHGCDENRFYKK